jgi:bifunctional oligoribonuclease and PAP phosphatase NrnA
MTVSLTEAWAKLMAMDDILLLTHRAPDGDAVGSLIALYRVLLAQGKNVRYIVEKPSKDLCFLLEGLDCSEFEEKYVVTVDVGDKKLLGQPFEDRYGDKVALSIDHHATNIMFAEDTLLDAGAAAASEVLFDMFTANGVTIDKDVAMALYVGIATDTGCFKYGNTTAKTLRATASLMDTGIQTAQVNTDIFDTKTKEYFALETMAMNSIKMYCNNKVAVLMLTKDMYRRANIAENETQGINGLPRQIAGVLIGITIKERESGSYRISMRTREDVDASAICALLGGGGHKQAAGCEMTAAPRTVISTILKYAEEALREQNLL